MSSVPLLLFSMLSNFSLFFDCGTCVPLIQFSFEFLYYMSFIHVFFSSFETLNNQKFHCIETRIYALLTADYWVFDCFIFFFSRFILFVYYHCLLFSVSMCMFRYFFLFPFLAAYCYYYCCDGILFRMAIARIKADDEISAKTVVGVGSLLTFLLFICYLLFACAFSNLY